MISVRDHLDSTRMTSPLTIPEGAEVIDTTHLTLEEVIETVLKRLNKLQLKRSQ